jgi:hypothetical protein
MASEHQPLAPLLGALGDLLAWLRAGRIQGVIIGGVAAALLGRPRVTHDVDALVLLDEDQWPSFLADGSGFGFVPRLPDPIAFAHSSRMLLVRHGPTGIDVDVSFGAIPFEEEALARASMMAVAGLNVPLPTPEDLIIMKAVAHRGRDAADIAAILDVHPHLDRKRVRSWVRAFADALETPEIFEDLQRLLARRPPPTRKRRKK